MEAKQWLLRARRLQARIDRLEEARRGAWERATSTTQRVSSDPVAHSGISRKAEGTADLIGAIDAERRRLDAIKAEIVAVTAQINDNTLAALILGYYVNGKTWEQVCVDISYSYQHTVHKLHPAALAAVDEIVKGGHDGRTKSPSV